MLSKNRRRHQLLGLARQVVRHDPSAHRQLGLIQLRSRVQRRRSELTLPRYLVTSASWPYIYGRPQSMAKWTPGARQSGGRPPNVVHPNNRASKLRTRRHSRSCAIRGGGHTRTRAARPVCDVSLLVANALTSAANRSCKAQYFLHLTACLGGTRLRFGTSARFR
jgi:hypothetical protein